MGKVQGLACQQVRLDLLRFPIDECLHTSLVRLAHDAGHPCDHVNFLGLSAERLAANEQDPRRGVYVRDEQRSGFQCTVRQRASAAGLVIIVPNVTPARQRELLTAILAHIDSRELTNAVVEADFTERGSHAANIPFLTAETDV